MEIHAMPVTRTVRVTLTLAVLAATALLVGVTAGSAQAANFDPHEFDVDVEMGPMDEDPGEPDCVPVDEDSMRCTMDMAYSEVGGKHKGTVRHAGKGLKGSISMVCDMDMRQRMVMISHQNGEQELEEFSGGGQMSCNWFMDFGATTLNGVISGDMDMRAVDYEQGIVAFTGRMTVNVVAGTGEFADTYGGGSWTEHDEFSVFGGPDGGPDGPDGPGDEPQSARAAGSVPNAANDGAMSLRLKKGRARTRVVSPSDVLRSGDRRTRLRVATARKARCIGVAKQAGKRVRLGKARDKDGNGDVTFRTPLARKLDAGKWSVKVACSYRSGGKNHRAAPTTQTYRVR